MDTTSAPVKSQTSEEYKKFIEWKSEYIDNAGKYTGINLRSYGFPYKTGAYIPVNALFSAFLQWRGANISKGIYLKK